MVSTLRRYNLAKGGVKMSVSNYILSLKRKYVQLNNLIQDELSRPLPNSLVLFDLKLRRLRLKEMITGLI